MSGASACSALLAASLFAAGCGDDVVAGASAGGSSSGSEEATSSTTSTPPSSSGTPATGTAESSSGLEGDTETSTSTGTGGSSSSSSGGEPFDCTSVPGGPFAVSTQFMPFEGSEDLSFDGQGGLAGKRGPTVIVVDGEGNELASYEDPGSAFGLRYDGAGDVLVAHFESGFIARIAPDGRSTTFASGIPGVNGLYPDFDGNVWVTDFSRVLRYDDDGNPTTIVEDGAATGANGLVYDPDRGVAFFTNYGGGRIAKVDIGNDGAPGAVTALDTVNGALFDGLSLDVCGNLYAVDNGNARVYRLMLDENADPLGDATDIVDGNMQNIANAQFGRGPGFEATSLYASGNPGIVYRLDVGVPGAPIPLP